jgi:hypothetical protein
LLGSQFASARSFHTSTVSLKDGNGKAQHMAALAFHVLIIGKAAVGKEKHNAVFQSEALIRDKFPFGLRNLLP